MVVYLNKKGIATSPDLVGDLKQFFHFINILMCEIEIRFQIFSLFHLGFPECVPGALS